jgi:hypothetical protein
MRCSACQLDVLGEVRTHYTSEIHRINTRRQIYGAPPITEEELNAEGFSDEVSLEINGICREEDPEEVKPKYRNRMPGGAAAVEEKCLFCDEDGRHEHYVEHGLSDEEVRSIQKRECYVCHEVFATMRDLECHVASGRHRNILIDGSTLILENGKVIKGSLRAEARTRVARRSARDENRMEVVKCVTPAERRLNPERKNQLKISMGMNSQLHFRIDWMQ